MSALIELPTLSVAASSGPDPVERDRRLGERLDSGATAGEGAANLLCAYMAAGVLAASGVHTDGCGDGC